MVSPPSVVVYYWPHSRDLDTNYTIQHSYLNSYFR